MNARLFKNDNEKLCCLVLSVLVLLLSAHCHVRQEDEQGPSVSFLEIASSKKTSGAKRESIGNFIQPNALIVDMMLKVAFVCKSFYSYVQPLPVNLGRSPYTFFTYLERQNVTTATRGT